jgi:hypothetical protein
MERSDQIVLATNALPTLKLLARDVMELLNSARLQDLPWEDVADDPKARADYMTRAMVLIQREHLSSVLSLVENGHDRDNSIIARSMLECLAQLRWALLDEPTRTDEWFWYGVMLERLQLLRNREKGILIDQDDWNTSERLIDQVGPTYFNRAARKAAENGNRIPPERERYRYRWHEDDISHVITNALNDEVAMDYWRSASAWSHASPLHVNRAMLQGEGTARYEPSDPREAAQALYIAIHSCLNTFSLACARFDLPHNKRIDDLFARLPKIRGLTV